MNTNLGLEFDPVLVSDPAPTPPGKITATLEVTEAELGFLFRELTQKEVETAYANHLNPALYRLHKISGASFVEDSAQGPWVKDKNGKTYFDCTAGFGVFSFGHSPQAIVTEVEKQLRAMPLSCKVLLNEPLARLARILAKITPGHLEYLFMCNSGTEAVEGALKLARAATQRSEIIYMQGAYHGKTLGALSVSSREDYRKTVYPLLPKCRSVPYGDVDALKQTLSTDTAAVILEPIQGEGGIHLPPEKFLKSVRLLCDGVGAKMIVDEVQTGLGRTGRVFACEWENVEPDLLCLGKAFGGGVIPCGAIVGNRDAMIPLHRDPFFHTSTFGGNPLACVAALAALKMLLQEQLARNAEVLGERLLSGLRALQKQFPKLVRSVRGRGLLIGIEMDRASDLGAISFLMRRRGFLVCHTLENNTVLRIEPPLTITAAHADLLLQVFAECLNEVNHLSKVSV